MFADLTLSEPLENLAKLCKHVDKPLFDHLSEAFSYSFCNPMCFFSFQTKYMRANSGSLHTGSYTYKMLKEFFSLKCKKAEVEVKTETEVEGFPVLCTCPPLTLQLSSHTVYDSMCKRSIAIPPGWFY